jgi:hypothetical protein
MIIMGNSVNYEIYLISYFVYWVIMNRKAFAKFIKFSRIPVYTRRISVYWNFEFTRLRIKNNFSFYSEVKRNDFFSLQIDGLIKHLLGKISRSQKKGISNNNLSSIAYHFRNQFLSLCKSRDKYRTYLTGEGIIWGHSECS